jgi:putative tryptophan/tyrosine transport system substrate-binding protein
MHKRVAVWALTIWVLAAISFADAQQPAKMPRIGFLFIGTKDQPHLESFRQGLRELGYVEGKNILIEYRYAEGRHDALHALAAELVALNPDAILTTTPQASRALVQASSAIPIIMTGFDPVRIGLVNSLAQPGRNLTGLTSDAGPGMIGKRLELLKESFPKIKIVGMLSDAASEVGETSSDLTKTAAKALRLQVKVVYLKEGADVERSYQTLKNLRVDALHMPPGSLTTLNSRRFIDLASKLRVPAIYHTRILVEEGGLMCYGVNFADLYRRAATYVDKILKGRKPTDLPIEQPMKFELVINLKAAKHIGLTIPPNVLARADRVIK